MRGLATIGICLLLASTAMAADPPAGNDTALQRQIATMTQVKSLILQHKPAEAIPLAETVIAEGEARAAAETRIVYSGQTPEMILANMLAAAAEKKGAVDIGPPYGEALFFKGFALIDAGKGDQAGAFLDRAAQVSPSNAQFLCEDAAWHAGHRDLEGALALYDRCRAVSGLMPADARARYDAAGQRGRGFVLIEQGKLDDAEKVYRARLATDPDDAKAQNELRYIQQQRAKAGRATT